MHGQCNMVVENWINACTRYASKIGEKNFFELELGLELGLG